MFDKVHRGERITHKLRLHYLAKTTTTLYKFYIFLKIEVSSFKIFFELFRYHFIIFIEIFVVQSLEFNLYFNIRDARYNKSVTREQL